MYTEIARFSYYAKQYFLPSSFLNEHPWLLPSRSFSPWPYISCLASGAPPFPYPADTSCPSPASCGGTAPSCSVDSPFCCHSGIDRGNTNGVSWSVLATLTGDRYHCQLTKQPKHKVGVFDDNRVPPKNNMWWFTEGMTDMILRVSFRPSALSRFECLHLT